MKSIFSYKKKRLKNNTPIFIYPLVDSTNDAGSRFIQQATSLAPFQQGLVLVSTLQTHGKGQFDRVWDSQKGGLYYTLLIPYPHYHTQSAEKAKERAQGVCYTLIHELRKIIPLSLEHKAPNDIYINGQKIGGVLIECDTIDNTAVMIIGIGLNINQKHFTDSLSLKATSVYTYCNKNIPLSQLIEAITPALLNGLNSQSLQN